MAFMTSVRSTSRKGSSQARYLRSTCVILIIDGCDGLKQIPQAKALQFGVLPRIIFLLTGSLISLPSYLYLALFDSAIPPSMQIPSFHTWLRVQVSIHHTHAWRFISMKTIR